MTERFGNFTEQDRSLLHKCLDALATAEQKRNAFYEWGTAEKFNSNNKLEQIYQLQQTGLFSIEHKSLLLEGLAEAMKAEQRRNASFDWGTPEKSDSNRALESLHSLQQRVQSSEISMKRPSLDSIIQTSQARAEQQTHRESKGQVLYR